MSTTKSYDTLNRLTQVSAGTNGVAVARFHYAYNTANQRTTVTNADNSRWAFGYDGLGQVTSGRKYWSDNAAVAGQQFEYAFDDLGNRTQTKAGGDAAGANLRSASYTANSLNQYTSRTVPGYLNVIGTAATNATVAVNSQATYRKGEYFRGELAVANGSSPVWQTITNAGVVRSTSTNNPDVFTRVTGHLFVAQTPEAFGYDADGNLTNDGRWGFTWDAENRLTKVESLASGPTASKRKVTWEYDAQGRRVRQTTYDGSSGSYVVTEDLKFLSDGWRHIAELNATNNALLRSYVWGLDLSGTMTGAGGVSGLLMLNSVANGTHFYAYDGNGNVTALVKSTDGTVSALYEYEPFGQTLRATGPMAEENRFQFSTKRCDRTTDLELYEFRVRRADLGWPNRDPIGEEGGPNLYGFVYNDPIQNVDSLGMIPVWIERLFKEAGYQFWREFVIGAPHWQAVMDDWYYETGPDPRTYVGISDPRNADIAGNAGFVKLLNCWVAKRRGVRVPSGPWEVATWGFRWKYVYDFSSAAGGTAAYTPATQFLGSYKANVRDLGRVDPTGGTIHKYQIDISNVSGWTSGTRLPGWAQRMRSVILGIDGTSLFYDHPRGGARYTPSRGGNLRNNYSFVVTADACNATCVLP
jgi:RHS repeat-associated protein